jgi:hypothetical protein
MISELPSMAAMFLRYIWVVHHMLGLVVYIYIYQNLVLKFVSILI